MTVAEVIARIGKISNSIQLLDYISTKYELKNAEAVSVREAIEELEHYIDELENKIVK